MSETTDSLHYDSTSFMAHRSRVALTTDVTPPQTFVLPGSLTPIHRDRLEAHQDEGLSELEIVEYENARFLQTNVSVRERHAQWVNRDYDAQVQAHREIEAERRRREAEANAAYHRRLAEILEAKDAHASDA